MQYEQAYCRSKAYACEFVLLLCSALLMSLLSIHHHQAPTTKKM
jgi:hypothetical protein